MSSQTTNLKLVKQDGNEYGDNDITNSNLDILDDEIGKRGKTVNGVSADDNGNYQINEVPFARQIITNDLQQSSAEYIERTTGGGVSIGNGNAKLVSILGRSVHTGVVEESLSMTVNTVEREEGEPITATIDRDTFVEYVEESGTITLEYTDAWSANPTLYGVTVSGEPVEGDTIVIVYVKANRGLITNSTPGKFISTGWNLYNHSNGYARVLKYSDQYGFMVGGTYSTIKFSATLDGTKTTITPVDGKFTIPSDGYVWITGGNATSTYIIMTWSDWTSGPSGTFQAYTESVINLATIMTNFPYGMMSVGGTADEIDFSTGVAISRIERIAYSAENVAEAEASGRAWDADENYIYIVKEEADIYNTSLSGDYAADDHGMEIIEGTTVPVFVQTLYGSNLVDKLRTDVVTKSQDLVNNLNQTSAGKALDARMGKTLGDAAAKARIEINYGHSTSDSASSLAEALIERMTTYGTYVFAGSWIDHGWGYTALCERSAYNVDNDSYYGTIMDNAGKAWAFTKRTTTDLVINEFVLENEIKREVIVPNSNFNSFTVAAGGIDKHYTGTNVGSISNRPSDIASTYNYAFNLDVETINGYTVQTLSIYGTSVQIYRRQQYYSNGYQWTSWEKFALRSDIEVKETTVSGSLRARKFGKVVCLNGYASVSISGQTVIGDALPQEYRPSDVIRGICNIGQNAYSANKIAYVSVGATSGQVEVTPPDSGSYSAVYMSLSWIVAG